MTSPKTALPSQQHPAIIELVKLLARRAAEQDHAARQNREDVK
jgi:hypothetical protein